MDDLQIVDLFWRRDESAVTETDTKYGRYLKKISYNILSQDEDVNECVNDTYMRAWNTMPSERPSKLGVYLGRIVRGLSIDLLRKKGAEKRGGKQYLLSLSELEECVDGAPSAEDKLNEKLLGEAISRYLYSLPAESRTVFVCRYFFCDSIEEIAKCKGCSQSKIKSLLFRTRKGLKAFLESEGFLNE
ncbi:MAG: RNA polymerase sigma factor [Clostridia bacterium]|nr:RNA polymerase sigma factor [Clostridia bacterium]